MLAVSANMMCFGIFRNCSTGSGGTLFRAGANPVQGMVEGLTMAGKPHGVYKGRKPTIDVTRVRKLRADGLGATEIADALKIGRSSVYRVLEAGR